MNFEKKQNDEKKKSGWHVASKRQERD